MSLHAAARAAQHHGRHLDERDLLASPVLRGRYERAVLRLFRRSRLVEPIEERSGLLANETRTRALVVKHGVVVTVIAAASARGFNEKKLRAMSAKLATIVKRSRS